MSEFSARFYGITHCGYFAYGGGAPSAGSLDFFLSELKDWSAGKSLEDTRVEGADDRLPTYLFDIKSHGSCWVLILWNEVPADEGAVASVPKASLVGGAMVTSNPIAANSIPGFPTYFLFLPDEEMVVPLIYGDSVLGMQQFKHYAFHFLQNSTSAVHYSEDGDEVEILGYEDGDGEVRSNLRARFDIQLKRSSAQAAAIIKRATSVRSIIRVAEVNTIAPPDRARFQKFLDFFNLTAEPAAKKVKIKQEIPVEVTQAQVKEMIDQLGDDVVARRNDLGFKFERDGKIYWLSGGIPRAVYDVSVAKKDGVFPAAGLARAFNHRKTQLVADANP